MSNVCTFDPSELDRILDALDIDNRRQIIVNALKAGGEILKQQTIDSLYKKVAKASSMSQGVKMTVDKDYITVIVSILKDYRLKWFEKGTTERYRKVRGINSKGKTYVKKDEKGGYTGQMTGVWFFKEAKDNEQPILDAIAASVEAQLNAIIK